MNITPDKAPVNQGDGEALPRVLSPLKHMGLLFFFVEIHRCKLWNTGKHASKRVALKLFFDTNPNRQFYKLYKWVDFYEVWKHAAVHAMDVPPIADERWLDIVSYPEIDYNDL